jgi:hypothetical protein
VTVPQRKGRDPGNRSPRTKKHSETHRFGDPATKKRTAKTRVGDASGVKPGCWDAGTWGSWIEETLGSETAPHGMTRWTGWWGHATPEPGQASLASLAPSAWSKTSAAAGRVGGEWALHPWCSVS